ncbi:MAG: hypothetical protein ACRD1S_11430 [Vicinamibacterales bacterium]
MPSTTKPSDTAEQKANGRLLIVPQLGEGTGRVVLDGTNLGAERLIPRVVLPGKDGRTLRRILVDRRDVDRFIEQSGT